ncbi:potassium voltage-gated channel protein Shaw isoform X1 [Patella vulgata]|uniref:potassium voltage-gated channel protein Shaw isoform X1 n=2 Tax=Patella vulgata TaxID=6465 RepID=UPI0024A987C2|nr:potassium voltage-gated channel protein Shaw isoform X1 [Patella vulgata]
MDTPDKLGDRRLRLNVGGVRFETLKSTLELKPGTRLALLAHLQESDETWDGDTDEYFFDRHPGAFTAILQYYRTDELHTDHNICGNIIKGELDFWGLSESDIEPCCWGNYSRFKDNKETLAALDDNFMSSTIESSDAWNEKPSNLNKFKRKMWIFLEDPTSSRGAKAYALLSMFFVLLSIGVFCLETHALFRVPLDGVTVPNGTVLAPSYTYKGEHTCCCRMKVSNELTLSQTEPHDAMTYLDYLCAAFFTFEYITRFFFAPQKVQFLKKPLNIIDILCLLPHFVSIILKTINPADSASQILKSVLALRIIRVLRIFKLMKHYTAFKILVYTIKVSTKELLLMVIFLFTGVLIFASIIFYVENSNFNSIPIGFWWALVTMTTVGYGDKVPESEGGYLIGSLCVLCGVLTVAFTVPIVVNNFTMYYAHAQSRTKIPSDKKRHVSIRNATKHQKATEFVKRVATNFNNLDELKTPRFSQNESGFNDNQQKGEEPYRSIFQSPDDNSSLTSSRIQSISANLENADLPPGTPSNLPGTPVHLDFDEKSPHFMESEQLLNDLKDAQEKLRLEKKRQLDLINQRRDQIRQQRTTPRPSPPADASKLET